jgi:hypothetical protein
MSCDISQSQLRQPENIDDEIAALSFQLEAIDSHSSFQRGKYKAEEPPDHVLALSSFRKEVESLITLYRDLKLAQSIS